MEKTDGREAVDRSTVGTGIENLGLELMVIHGFNFCTVLWSAAGPHVGSLALLNPHLCWQGLVIDLNSSCAYRKKEKILREPRGLKSKDKALGMGLGLPLTRGTGVLESIQSQPKDQGWAKCGQ